MHINNIIDHWYREYLEATFLTETEYRELVELCDIITQGSSIIEPWSRQELKQRLPMIIPSGAIVCRLREFKHRELKGEQGSDQWLKSRMSYITASVSAACAGIMGASSRENQLLEKASFGKYRPFKGGYYTEKGNMFEDVTNAYYSYINKGKIWAFNLIPHNNREYDFLGASTDGVSNRLINIEIKTLVARDIDKTKFKKEYMHQMQHQMECLNLDETDFIEVKYSEHDSIETTLINCEGHVSRMGVIIESWDTREEKMYYEYAPIGLNVDALKAWEERKTELLSRSKRRLYIRSVYWTMTDYLCRRVKRDPNWIRDMGPKLRKFWDEVQELRENPKELQRRITAKSSSSRSRSKVKSKRNEPPELDRCML